MHEMVSGNKAYPNMTPMEIAARLACGPEPDLSDDAIVGFINNYGSSEQPTAWQSGLVSAVSTGGTTTR